MWSAAHHVTSSTLLFTAPSGADRFEPMILNMFGLLTSSLLGYISKEDVTSNNIFRSDDFALVELKVKDANNFYTYNGFGYIKFCSRIDMKDDTIINKEIAELCPSVPHTNLKFTLVTPNLSNKEICSKHIVIKVIANIASYLRLIRTIKWMGVSVRLQKGVAS
ncbi:hypothetical protein NQ318_000137 [Aromia moschata]|uniref:Uncharacterized protein n=1 Tax=Aromia moschata TaxID=1265417 RepID=A0AAV8XI43_9CUCU|nr:hypothetical protein NQ318_000137 [Aromia moschata]